MNESIAGTLGAILLIVLILSASSCVYREARDECEAKGGVLVRSIGPTSECVRGLERLP